MKFKLTIALLLFWCTLSAQVDDSKQVQLTVQLNSSMVLSIDNDELLFEFTTLEQFTSGIESSLASQINGSVSATCNWSLAIRSTEPSLNHSDGINTMPLDLVGYTVSLTGNYGPDRITNYAASDPIALNTNGTTVLTKGTKTNAGSSTSNAFSVNWEMGTTNGNMNNVSVLEGDYKKGQYSTNIDFIVAEIL